MKTNIIILTAIVAGQLKERLRVCPLSSPRLRWCLGVRALSALLFGLVFATMPVRAADGDVDPGFNPGANSHVYSLAMQADGKILVGGAFTTLGGQPRDHIGRLNEDGTLDSGFNPGADHHVAVLAVQADGKILAVGAFTTLGGQPRNYLARLNEDGTLDSGFDPGVGASVGYGVNGLAVQADGKILVAGGFSTLGGQPRDRIGRLNADGTLDSAFNPGANLGENSPVVPMAVQADGKVLVGGEFTTLGGQPRSHIARLNADGTLDSGFNLGANNNVLCLVMQADGKILVGGRFTTLGGQPRSAIGRLNADGTLDSGFNPVAEGGYAGPIVFSLAVQADGKILVGGQFTTLGGQPRTNIGRLLNGPATQTFSAPDATQVQWLRGGTAPEVEQVTFEQSTNSTSYTLLGNGTRISGGWQLTGLSLPAGQTFYLRARGRATSGEANVSSGLIESVQQFYIPDTTPPTVSCPPAVSVDADFNQCHATGVVLDTPAASDNSGSVTVTNNAPAQFPVGTNLVTWIASDPSGNSNTCVQLVIVRDAQAPAITCPPNITVEFTNEAGAVVTYSVTAADNCDPSPGVTCVPPSGSVFPIGATIVHCTASDANGNSASCSFTVTVLGSRGVKENILAELIALRATLGCESDSNDNDEDENDPDYVCKKLNNAIKHLTKSLAAELWVDQTHLERKHGDKVFKEEKHTVKKLCDLIKSKKSNIPDAVLQGFIDRIFRADRLLASVAIQEAIAAGVSQKKIEQAQKYLAKGDADVGDDKCDNGIEDYSNAWKHAVRAKISPPVHLANGHTQLEILGQAGEWLTFQASSNLVDWVTIGTGTANADGVVMFEDADAGQYPVRYYRAVSQ